MVAKLWGPARLGEVNIAYDGAVATLHGPQVDGGEVVVAGEQDALREWVRYDGSGRYRPLTGARTLRGGWLARCVGVEALAGALEAIYPLALEHQEAARTGTLRVVGLKAVLRRQAGRYRMATELGATGRNAARTVLCGQCVRTPVWAGEPLADDAIPCPEACSVMVALCREAALWERERPARATVGEAVPYAQFEAPGNALREAYLGERFGDATAGAGGEH